MPAYGASQTSPATTPSEGKYQTLGVNLVILVAAFCIKIDSVNGIGLIRERYEVFVMDAGGSRYTAAKRDLQEAKGGYETRTVTRIKRKIAELEAQAKQEEEGRMEEDIAVEVD